MQQTKKRRTDLARSINYNIQKSIQEKQKSGNLTHIGSAKQKRFIHTKSTKKTNKRSVKKQRCKIAKILVRIKPKDDELI